MLKLSLLLFAGECRLNGGSRRKNGNCLLRVMRGVEYISQINSRALIKAYGADALVAARCACGAKGSLGQRPNVPGAVGLARVPSRQNNPIVG